tara:strand:+ start:765 stop:1631 length:867 start_codon:yes stop_codon:yes gene_type:complete
MAYQTGTYSGPVDLLTLLRTFVLANGWTQNGWTADGTGNRLHIQKGSMYYNLRSGAGEDDVFAGTSNATTTPYAIYLNGSTGYAGGSPWDRQPGSPESETGEGAAAGKVSQTQATYHMFAQADTIILFVECDDQYRQIMFGQTSAGYHIFGASGNARWPEDDAFLVNASDGSMSALYEGVWTFGDSTSKELQLPNNSYSILNRTILVRSAVQFRGNALLLPAHIMRTSGSGQISTPYFYLGDIRGLKSMYVGGHSDGDVITYAGDEYVVSVTDPSLSGIYQAGVAALK